jgi:hypothetical protein
MSEEFYKSERKEFADGQESNHGCRIELRFHGMWEGWIYDVPVEE